MRKPGPRTPTRRPRRATNAAPARRGRGRGAAVVIDISITARLGVAVRRGLRRLLAHVAEFVLTQEGFHAGELSIAIVDDDAMRRMHARYMNDPTTTDVLTFDLGGNRDTGLIDGEIVVCADVARRSAARPGDLRPPPATRVAAELALYVAHGVLHLAGYDDRTTAAYRRMHAREDALLEQFGLGRVFADPPLARRGSPRR